MNILESLDMLKQELHAQGLSALSVTIVKSQVEQLQSENISLRAERDALLKSFTVTSKPIEVIQPKGVVE